jgi:hypothetical protein
VGHLDGDEGDNSRENVVWNCRACNTRLGWVFTRLGLGRCTRQFNPKAAGGRNLAQWLMAVLSMKASPAR